MSLTSTQDSTREIFQEMQPQVEGAKCDKERVPEHACVPVETGRTQPGRNSRRAKVGRRPRGA